MSDTPESADWWLAVDGRWYPPHLHPDAHSVASAAAPEHPSETGTGYRPTGQSNADTGNISARLDSSEPPEAAWQLPPDLASGEATESAAARVLSMEVIDPVSVRRKRLMLAGVSAAAIALIAVAVASLRQSTEPTSEVAAASTTLTTMRVTTTTAATTTTASTTIATTTVITAPPPTAPATTTTIFIPPMPSVVYVPAAPVAPAVPTVPTDVPSNLILESYSNAGYCCGETPVFNVTGNWRVTYRFGSYTGGSAGCYITGKVVTPDGQPTMFSSLSSSAPTPRMAVDQSATFSGSGSFKLEMVAKCAIYEPNLVNSQGVTWFVEVYD